MGSGYLIGFDGLFERGHFRVLGFNLYEVEINGMDTGILAMKILQVSPRYFPCYGGVEEHVKNISEGLSKNHEVVVCTTDPSGRLEKEEVIKGVEVKRFKSFAPSDSYYFSGDLKKYLHDNCHEFDVVHAHSYHAFPVRNCLPAEIPCSNPIKNFFSSTVNRLTLKSSGG